MAELKPFVGRIICGFAGIGKSTLARKRATVVDLESTPFQRDWVTYARVANHMKINGYTVLVSCHDELRTQLHNMGVEYDVVLPKPELKEVFVRRYVERGNTKEFVNLLIENWTDFCKELPWENPIRIGAEFLANIIPAIDPEELRPRGVKPQTNADRIRAMSDEELAEWMEEKSVTCNDCSEYNRCKEDPAFNYAPCDGKCATHYLDWLEQPAEVLNDG